MRNPDDLEKIAHAMDRPREEYLKWKAVLERYEQGKHTKFAECFLKSTGDTVKERELIAYASEDYKKYLDEWDTARKGTIKAQVKFDNLKCAFDALQSALSYDREAMKRLGG